jgi:hypothetical protein
MGNGGETFYNESIPASPCRLRRGTPDVGRRVTLALWRHAGNEGAQKRIPHPRSPETGDRVRDDKLRVVRLLRKTFYNENIPT